MAIAVRFDVAGNISRRRLARAGALSGARQQAALTRTFGLGVTDIGLASTSPTELGRSRAHSRPLRIRPGFASRLRQEQGVTTMDEERTHRLVRSGSRTHDTARRRRQRIEDAVWARRGDIAVHAAKIIIEAVAKSGGVPAVLDT